MSVNAVEAVQHAVRRGLGCDWCGAPTGRPGVTLRKVYPKPPYHTPTTMAFSYLCPPCAEEYRQFGRRLPFREWVRLYRHLWWQGVGHALRRLGLAVSLRWHWREVSTQWRFRSKGIKVRA